MDLFEILGSPILGNLLILLAAIIGIVGSYLIYYVRLRNKRDSARRAIKSELESMTFFPQWIEEVSPEIPIQSIGTSLAYESHLNSIGLLSDTEIEKLTKFYSSLVTTNDMLRSNSETILQSGLAQNTIDRGRGYREDVLASRVNQLAVWRWQVIQVLKKKLGESYESPEFLDIPKSSGNKIHTKHPFFRSNKDQLLSEGYVEPVNGEPKFYQLTDDGEDWIENTLKDDLGF